MTIVTRFAHLLQLNKQKPIQVTEENASDVLSACGLRLEHIHTVLQRNKILTSSEDTPAEIPDQSFDNDSNLAGLNIGRITSKDEDATFSDAIGLRNDAEFTHVEKMYSKAKHARNKQLPSSKSSNNQSRRSSNMTQSTNHGSDRRFKQRLPEEDKEEDLKKFFDRFKTPKPQIILFVMKAPPRGPLQASPIRTPTHPAAMKHKST